jgi:hypothetical protein
VQAKCLLDSAHDDPVCWHQLQPQKRPAYAGRMITCVGRHQLPCPGDKVVVGKHLRTTPSSTIRP